MVYLYARVSTKEQTTIESQFEGLEKIAEGLGITEYKKVSEKKSGKNIEGREVFSWLLENTVKGDEIFVWDVTRFGREASDNLTSLKSLEKKGVKVYSRDIGYIDSNNNMTKTMFGIMSIYAEQDRSNINTKSQIEMVKTKEEGRWVLRGDTFGYSVGGRPKHRIVTINENEAGWVRYIFKEYLRGRSCNSLAKELEDKEFQSGIKLNCGQIRRMLYKPIYMGYYTKDSLTKFDDSKKKTKDYTRIAGLPEEELRGQLIKSQLYPPIIKEETWWEVFRSFRKVTRKHAVQYAYRNTPYELTGIIKSACCGKGYVHSFCKKGFLGEVYTSSTHTKECTERVYKYLRKDLAEGIMRMTFFLTFIDAGQSGMFYEDQRKFLQDSVDELKTQLDSIEKQLKENQRKKDNLGEFIAEGGHRSIIQKQEDELIEQEKNLNKEKNDIQNAISIKYGDLEDYLLVSCDKVIREFIDAPSSEVRRDFFKKFCSATMSRDTFTITYENGKKFVVHWHKYRYNPKRPLRFEMYFKDKLEDTGTYEPESNTLVFDKLEEVDEFWIAYNKYGEKKAKEVEGYVEEIRTDEKKRKDAEKVMQLLQEAKENTKDISDRYRMIENEGNSEDLQEEQ